MLDPRFKLGYIAFSYENEFGEEDGKRRVDIIRDLLNDIYILYEKATNEKASSINVALEGNMQGSNSTVASGSKRKHDEAYMQWLSKQHVSKKPKRTEINCYLDEPSFGLMEDENFNLLGWWKNNATIYPILASMAKDFLAVPVSSVASESAFSTGGRVIDPHRTRLAPDTIEALICAQDWLNQDFNLDEDTLSCITVVAEELDSDSMDQVYEDE